MTDRVVDVLERLTPLVDKLSHNPAARYHVVELDGRPVWESDELRIARANAMQFPGSEIIDTHTGWAVL